MIQVDNISKYYKVPERKQGRFSAFRSLVSGHTRLIPAVTDMSFHIAKGEFVGYIGPNGAGKSTTIKMLTGILHPDAGHITINGLNPQHDRKQVAAAMGVVFGQRTQLWWDLPCRDSFELLKHMYKVSQQDYDKVMDLYADMLGLHEFLDTPVRKLSLGQRMRADLAAALLHSPDILFLDEPTIGLDVMAKTRIRAFLQELNRQEAKTILLTTHDMEDIEQLCSRILIINRGQKVYDGSLDNLREMYQMPSLLEVEFSGHVEQSSLPEMAQFDSALNKAKISFDKRTNPPLQLINRISQCGDIKDIQIQGPKIEEIIQHIYQQTAASPVTI